MITRECPLVPLCAYRVLMFDRQRGIAEQVQRQRLKVIGVSTAKRHPDFPNAPTMSESGFPGFEEYTQGTERGSTPAEFKAWLAKDLERWARVAR